MTINGYPVVVEDACLQSRSFRRRRGEVPYPVQHIGAACSTFDVWNDMFRTQGQNLTLHKFETPPPFVLDLGCGSGYWAIEAAKKWPNSRVFGFDVKDIQPKLGVYDLDIARRVTWVHGNLLDGLPFHYEYFDFVRIVNIGLGVPEDEWQCVFEEVLRVLKPGGVIEVIEEDPIFPCEIRPPPWGANYGNSSMTLVNHSPSLLVPLNTPFTNASSPTIWSDRSSVTLHERYESKSLTSPNNLTFSTPPSPAYPLSPQTPISSYSTPHLHLQLPRHLHHLPITPSRPPNPQIEMDRSSDLQDHSRLKAAWDAMLCSRFIAENTTSVLPFYLSYLFADVQGLPPIKVLLPPNSEIGQSSTKRPSSQSFTSMKLDNAPPLVRTTSSSTTGSEEQEPTTPTPSSLSSLSRTSSTELVESYTTEYAQMHLANTVHVVTGCKEAIWQEYRKLYDVNVAKVVSPNAFAPSGYIASSGPGNVKSSIRESFDDEWASWFNDMTDRIGMRTLMSQLDWNEPPGQRPDWHIWRAKVQQHQANENQESFMSANDPPALCRSMRGFIGRKPLVTHL